MSDNISWGKSDYSQLMDNAREEETQERLKAREKNQELEKNIKKEMTKLVKSAQKMYDQYPVKEYYDFLVTLESADRALKF